MIGAIYTMLAVLLYSEFRKDAGPVKAMCGVWIVGGIGVVMQAIAKAVAP